MSSIKIKFVSKKISKVRFQPKSTSTFVTGSYNDEENIISVWKFPDQIPISADDDNNLEDEPAIISSAKFKGCVTDLKVISEELIFASSSLGSVSIYSYANQEDKMLKCIHMWEKVHSFKLGPASATAISVKGHNLASVGEDGKLCLINFHGERKIKEIVCSDLCSFTCVTHLRHQEVIAGNSLGYMRLWDLRVNLDGPSCLLSLLREPKGVVSSLAVHPAQSHVLVSGYEDGSLCIWDMRQDRKPVSILEGHNGAVSDHLFHPTNPDLMFTCSCDGCVWQWDASNIKKASTPGFSDFGDLKDGNSPNTSSVSKGNHWLHCDANKHRLEVTALSMQSWSCINSLDVSESILLWTTDNEELCIQNDINV